MKKRIALALSALVMFCGICFSQTPELDKKISVLKSGDFSESMAWLNQLEKELKPHYSESDFLFAILFNRKAVIYDSEYNYEKAASERKKIIAVLEKMKNQDKNIADVWREIGRNYSNAGKVSDSIEAHTKALAIYKKLYGDYHEDTASEYNNLANEYADMDNFDEAWKYYKKLMEIAEKIDGENSVDTAIVYANVGYFFNKKGDYAKAVEYLEKALSIAESAAPGHPIAANFYNNLAANYSSLGDEDMALAYSAKALGMAEKSYEAENPELRVFYNSYASYILENAKINSNVNSITQAILYYNKAANLSSKLNLFDDTFRVSCQEYGALLMETGPKGWIEKTALNHMSKEEYDKSLPDELVKLINGMLTVAQGRRFYPEYDGAKKINDGARLFFNIALYIRQNTAGVKEDGVVSNLHHLIAISYARDGDRNSAKRYFNKALDIDKKLYGEFHPQCASIYFDLGCSAYESGDKKTAAAEWKNALKAYENSQNHASTIDRIKDILFYKLDDKNFTQQAISLALASAEKARLDSDARKSFIMKKVLPVYYCAVKFSAEQNDAKKAFEYSEQMRSRAFLDQMGVEEALKLDGITEERRKNVRSLIDEIGAAKKEFEGQNALPLSDRDAQAASSAAKRVSDAEKKLSALDAEIAKSVPKYAQLRNPQTVSAAQTQAWCPQSRAVVEYVLWSDDYSGAGNENGSKNSYCVILTKSKVQILPLDGAFDFSASVNSLRKKIISGAAEKDFERERNDLYARLCEPVAANLGKGINELIIVPDGNLSFLPFDILRKNSLEKDFGELYAIELSPSISISCLLGKNSSSMGSALAFGGAWYDKNLSEAQHRQVFANAATGQGNSRKIQAVNVGTENLSANDRERVEALIAEKGIGGYLASKNAVWADLPGTLQEVNRLEAGVFLNGTISVRTQEQATESAVKKLSGEGRLLKYPILHFACHGYFDNYVPEICSLVFSEVSGRFSKISDEDGYLTVPEVSVLNLNADMVCLSACETGLGEVRSGEGLVGLSRGFMVAGARNVGVSLWSVDDEATSEFMARMYDKRRQGMGYADAYRAVKEEFRKDSRWSHPFYWAAFTLYGGAGGGAAKPVSAKQKGAGPSAEETYQKGRVADQQKNYADAFSYYLEVANAGHAAAQGMVAEFYFDGKGVNSDYAKAVEWASKAAKKNDVNALVVLGGASYLGNGVKKDSKKAASYFQKASDLGSPAASDHLSYLYANGDGVKKDGEKAFSLCKKAADSGYASAQIHLGNMYADGTVVKQDYAKAAECYGKAAEQGNAEAQVLYAKAFYDGSGVQKDFARAASYFEKAASANNAEALNWMGVLHYNGEGVPKDMSKAIEYFSKSAELGYSVGQFNLGLMYEGGVEPSGGKDFYARAFSWYEKSADQGYAPAQRKRADFLYNGLYKGEQPDYQGARSWYGKAAAQGDALAQHSLARMFYDGIGSGKDYNQAFKLEKEAAAQGVADAQYWAGYMLDYGRGTAKDHAAANAWYEKAAKAGNADAMKELGYNYRQGIGVAKDYAKANELFLKAAENGNAAGNFYLGVAYDFGYGVQKDDKKAVEFYERAARQGQSDAQSNLGNMYRDGRGVPQDYIKAREWYEKAAAQNSAAAQFNLGNMYDNGRGVPQDYVKASEWYEKAAVQNHARAQLNLGFMYYKGNGVPQDYAKALELFNKSAAQGNAVAQNNLGIMYEHGQGCQRSIPNARNWYQKAAKNGHEDAKKALARLGGSS